MLRPLFAISALLLAAAPAAAATYTATLAAPAAEGRIASRDILWNCAGADCAGSTVHSRPLLLCAGLAKKAGRIASFAVDGRPLPAQELQRCNASAPRERNAAVANAR